MEPATSGLQNRYVRPDAQFLASDSVRLRFDCERWSLERLVRVYALAMRVWTRWMDRHWFKIEGTTIDRATYLRVTTLNTRRSIVFSVLARALCEAEERHAPPTKWHQTTMREQFGWRFWFVADESRQRTLFWRLLLQPTELQ